MNSEYHKGFTDVSSLWTANMAFLIDYVWNTSLPIPKNIFPCSFSVHNIISLSCHEQVCLMRHMHVYVYFFIMWLAYYILLYVFKYFQKILMTAKTHIHVYFILTFL